MIIVPNVFPAYFESVAVAPPSSVRHVTRTSGTANTAAIGVPEADIPSRRYESEANLPTLPLGAIFYMCTDELEHGPKSVPS